MAPLKRSLKGKRSVNASSINRTKINLAVLNSEEHKLQPAERAPLSEEQGVQQPMEQLPQIEENFFAELDQEIIRLRSVQNRCSNINRLLENMIKILDEANGNFPILVEGVEAIRAMWNNLIRNELMEEHTANDDGYYSG